MTPNDEHIKRSWIAPMAQMKEKNTVFTEAFAWLNVFSITQRISIGAEKADMRIDLESV